MRYYTLTIVFLATLFSNAQSVIPMVDFNGYFKSFQDGYFKQIEFQQIQEFTGGDNIVAYVDIRGNLRAYDGTNLESIANVNTVYTVSDNLLTWQIGETLNLWDSGMKKTLSFYTGQYVVKDSLVVFQDHRFKTLNVYYDGEIYPLVTALDDFDMKFADFVGENIVAYRDNGNVYKVFWRGKTYELDAWHDPIPFEGGTDILAFNDPITGTFAIFEDGVFKDLEEFHMNEYKAGRGFIVYENQNNELMFYQSGERKKLTNFRASSWEVKDDVVFWVENGISYAWQNGKKIELARYNIEEVVLKNNVIAFRNLMGGVDALMEGKVINITNQTDAQFKIYGNTVLVELFNRSYIVRTAEKSYQL